MVRFIAVDDNGKITGTVAKPAIESVSKGAFPGLPEALAASKKAAASQATYKAAADAAVAATRGAVVGSTSFETASEHSFDYGASQQANGTARTGTNHLLFPVNADPAKEIGAYYLPGVPVTQGKKYALRVWLRSAGTVGDAQIQFRVSKVGTDGKTTYWTTTSYVPLSTTLVTSTGWTEYQVTWTAPATETARPGIFVKALTSALHLDDFTISDVSSIPTTFPARDAAKAAWEADVAAARTAWVPILPEGVIASSSSDSAVVSLTSAQYKALAVKDPTKLYLVTD